jgi:hypothetical protein
MFFIPILLKTGHSKVKEQQNLGVIVSDVLTIASNVNSVKTVIRQNYEDSLEIFTENYYAKTIISKSFDFVEDYKIKLYNLIVDYLFKLSYSQITSIALENFLSARFLPDYHVIEYLAKESQLDRYSISKVLVALSNLLRDCQEYDVRQINAISLRIHKAIMNENKTVFVITEF